MSDPPPVSHLILRDMRLLASFSNRLIAVGTIAVLGTLFCHAWGDAMWLTVARSMLWASFAMTILVYFLLRLLRKELRRQPKKDTEDTEDKHG